MAQHPANDEGNTIFLALNTVFMIRSMSTNNVADAMDCTKELDVTFLINPTVDLSSTKETADDGSNDAEDKLRDES